MNILHITFLFLNNQAPHFCAFSVVVLALDQLTEFAGVSFALGEDGAGRGGRDRGIDLIAHGVFVHARSFLFPQDNFPVG